jgi:hypothetical protein
MPCRQCASEPPRSSAPPGCARLDRLQQADLDDLHDNDKGDRVGQDHRHVEELEGDVELVAEFFQAFAANSGITLHFNSPYWTNLHHIIEALFKAFARALDEASALDARTGAIPSTKGKL